MTTSRPSSRCSAPARRAPRSSLDDTRRRVDRDARRARARRARRSPSSPTTRSPTSFEPRPALTAGRHRRRRAPSLAAGALLISRRPEVAAARDRRRPALPRPRDRRRGDRQPAAAALRRHRRRLPGLPPRQAATPTRRRRTGASPGCAARWRHARALRGPDAVLVATPSTRSRTSASSTSRSRCCSACCSTCEWKPRLLMTAFGDRHRARAPLRRRRLLRVRHRPPADHELEAARGQRRQAVLPRQLGLLRPEHLRPLPGPDDDRAGRRAAVDAAAARRPRTSPLALAILWGGLLLSLSQSSFAALLIGLAVLAALRWRARPVLIAVVTAAVASAVVIAVAGEEVGVKTESEASVNRATSGRVDLVEGALDMIRDRPVQGYGSGVVRRRLPRAHGHPLQAHRRRLAHHAADRRRRAGADRPGRLRLRPLGGAGAALRRPARRRPQPCARACPPSPGRRWRPRSAA